ncbi:MAG: hypothetical protein NWE82_00745 [Candidatus Bathyarchaeota archaeon]|jgi:hypothetical protein|nr:hypothetical protein [Candidatus Bathyarchaeota archaeon]
MTKTRKHPHRDIPRDKDLTASLKNLILLKDLPLEAKLEEARKPIYLVRYE